MFFIGRGTGGERDGGVVEIGRSEFHWPPMEASEATSVRTGTILRSFSIGIWCVALPILAFLFPTPQLRYLLRATHPRPNACSTCGYDLRASPERCPECGNAARKQLPVLPRGNRRGRRCVWILASLALVVILRRPGPLKDGPLFALIYLGRDFAILVNPTIKDVRFVCFRSHDPCHCTSFTCEQSGPRLKFEGGYSPGWEESINLDDHSRERILGFGSVLNNRHSRGDYIWHPFPSWTLVTHFATWPAPIACLAMAILRGRKRLDLGNETGTGK
jgi:hypothetical protein